MTEARQVVSGRFKSRAGMVRAHNDYVLGSAGFYISERDALGERTTLKTSLPSERIFLQLTFQVKF